MATRLALLFILALAAISPVSAADNHTAELERVAAGLRLELEQSRSQTANRVRDAKAGLESALQLKQAQLDQAKTEVYTARQIAGTKDSTIDALRQQVEALQARPDAAVKVAEVAKEAVTKAAHVATVRHAEYAAALNSDHDILVRISERMDSMREAIDQERGVVTGRLTTAETNITSLESSRTQMAGYAAGAGAVATLLMGLAFKAWPMIRPKAV